MNNYHCNYDYTCAENTIRKRGTLCFGTIKNKSVDKKAVTTILIRPDYSDIANNSFPHEEKQMLRYLSFLNECGLTCHYDGFLLNEDFQTEYDDVIEDTVEDIDWYHVSVKDEDMINCTHRLATLTGIRYLYENYYTDIPSIIEVLRDDIPEWDNFEILMLAEMLSKKHWAKNTGRSAVHGMIPNAAKLQTQKEYFENIETYEPTSVKVNQSFEAKGRLTYSTKQSKELYDLYKEKEYSKIKKQLS